MRRIAIIVISLLVLLPVAAVGQSFSTLWKQATQAEQRDLPRTQVEVLRKIAKKAEAEKSYGQLLRAQLKCLTVMNSVSPDSLLPAIRRMEEDRGRAANATLRAVYDAALCKIYREAAGLGDSAQAKAAFYRRQAMARPDALARVTDHDYVPLVIEGKNASIFNGDMLSVIGCTVEDYQTLFSYYNKAGNRRATCIAALLWVMKNRPADDVMLMKKSRYRVQLDSLVNVFGDLDVAGEVAVERYHLMEQCSDVTVEDKIAYIHYALGRWGQWQRSNELRNAERGLTAPMYEVLLKEELTRPNVAQTLRLNNLRHLDELTLRLYRVNGNGELKAYPNLDDDFKRVKPLLSPLPQHTKTLKAVSAVPWLQKDDSIVVDGLPAGVYMLEVQTLPNTRTWRALYYVSDVSLMRLALPGGKTRFVAVSATTGHPLPGARVKLSRHNYRTGKSSVVQLTCDSNGEVVFNGNKMLLYDTKVYVSTEHDKACPSYSLYGTSLARDLGMPAERHLLRLFTDRSIYRPGQTVKMAGWLFGCRRAGDRLEALGGRQVKVTLHDANRKVVCERTVTTDDYGTCSSDFVLPKTGLTGRFLLSAREQVDGSAATKTLSIRVEQYKRPTFKVEFPEVRERYQAGDTLMVRGRAVTYAGVPVQGATVSYGVDRRIPYWWRSYSACWNLNMTEWQEPENNIFVGKATTDGDGYFTVEVPLVLPKGLAENPVALAKSTAFYHFKVSADVTDASGESHAGEMVVPLGTRPAALTCDLPRQVLADSLKQLKFHLKNAAGADIDAPLSYYIDNRSNMMTARTNVALPLEGRLSSGNHHLEAYCSGDTLRLDFVVFGLDDTRLAAPSKEWTFVSSEEFPADGRPVTLQVGSSENDIYVVYTMMTVDSVIESGTALLRDVLMNRKLVYRNSYGDALTFACAWTKGGELHQWSTQIKRPQPDLRLNVSWTTFRDRLVPGQREQWKLHVARPDGQPAGAQLLATLYDQSLDQLCAHRWTDRFLFRRAVAYALWMGMSVDCLYGGGAQSWKSLKFHTLDMSRFDPKLFNLWQDNGILKTDRLRIRGRGMMMMAKANSTEELNSLAASDMALNEKPMAKAGPFEEAQNVQSAAEAEEKDAGTADNVQVRENMNETAFFYPALLTDEHGEVTIGFTLPESVTAWQFMGAAHTKDMREGYISAVAEARKDVMILPNMPRFVRQGDRLVLKAKVYNGGDRTAVGNAKVEFIDPESEKNIFNKVVSVRVPADSTATVSFGWQVDTDCPLLICRITVAGKGFGDGEQHYLPVLPERERVTVTVPVTQTAPGTTRISLKPLFADGSTRKKLTVEYANTPVWLAIQALPMLGTPREDNAVSLCAAYYSQTLASAILRDTPKAKTAFELWRNEQGGETSLVGQLAKNEELKDVVLDETPWVADADAESLQKERLATFFDENSLENARQSLAVRLKKLQNVDGSFSWWPGMRGSRMVTAEVVQMLARLSGMAGSRPQTMERMYRQALDFLDKEAASEVAKLKENARKGRPAVFPGLTALQWLYIHALDGGRTEGSVQQSVNYLMPLLKREVKSQSIYEKALSAIVLKMNGEQGKAAEYVRSLKEYTVFSEQMGRYYDTPRAGYSWCDYRIPAQVAAIEAIRSLAPSDTLTVAEMQRWILQQKRTQMWDTPVSTVNAVYALVHGSGNIGLASVPPVLTLGRQVLEMPKATAALGYAKVSVDNPKAAELAIDKTSQGVSWGAVYAQSMQRTGDVAASGSDLSVKRELLANGPLTVGARVKVRITIESKRNLDFVQLADRRAACMEPVQQLSGYRNGAYCSMKDNATFYYFDQLPKGKRVIETEYYLDREGTYQLGTCTVECAYSPEFRATAHGGQLRVETRR